MYILSCSTRVSYWSAGHNIKLEMIQVLPFLNGDAWQCVVMAPDKCVCFFLNRQLREAKRSRNCLRCAPRQVTCRQSVHITNFNIIFLWCVLQREANRCWCGATIEFTRRPSDKTGETARVFSSSHI